MLNMFESPASSQLSLVSWSSLTYHRDSKTAHHANARVFTLPWNKKPWTNRAELGSADARTRAACTARRRNPLASTHHGTLRATLGQCSVRQDPTKLQSPSQERTKEPEALFFFLQRWLNTGYFFQGSSHLAAVNLLTPAGRNWPKQALFKEMKHSR